MSIIKIPSSNIFDVDVDSYLVAKNKITAVEMSVNYFEKRKANVLKNDFVMTFWEEKPSTQYGEVTFVGKSENAINTVSYQIEYDPQGDLDYWNAINVDYGLSSSAQPQGAWLPIDNKDKFVNIRHDSDGNLAGLSATRTNYVLDLAQPEKSGDRYRQVPLSFGAENIKYVSSENALSVVLPNPQLDIAVDGDIGVDEQVYVEYRLLRSKISIEGECYTPTSKSLKYPSNATLLDNFISLPTNELCQDHNTLPGIAWTTSVLTSVFSKYKNGKEVYEIKCSIADYYDTDGNLIISPNNSNFSATFEMHTIVEPYVFTSGGEVPLSTKADGTPKRFEIIGIDYSYSGVAWQKLIIQESK